MSTSHLRELYRRDTHFIAYLVYHGAKIAEIKEYSLVLDCTFLKDDYDTLRIQHTNSVALAVDEELLKIKRIWQEKKQKLKVK